MTSGWHCDPSLPRASVQGAIKVALDGSFVHHAQEVVQ